MSIQVRRTLLAASVLMTLVGLAPAQELSAPEKNFEHLWKTYDRNYALFGAKHIDWDALYRVYRPRITAQTTDEELFQVCADLLGNLNDNHVRLTSPARQFQSGILGQMKMDDFSLDLVKSKYLNAKSKSLVDGVFDYGWLTDSIGYFHFRGFGRIEQTTAAIDQIINELKDAKAIVVDVRSNGGGDDRVGKLIADRFADRKRLYMKTAIRNGPQRDSFTPWKYWYVEPGGPIQFTKPVILLTHRFSVSAAENFALAMRVLPNVTVVGDATSGVFADVYGDRLPNAWRFSVSFKLFVDVNDFCWEGIGVPADIRQVNTKQDIEQKRDRVLELAVALIERGNLKPQDEPASLRDIRESLAKNLVRDLDQNGIDQALKNFKKARSGSASSYYVDLEELLDGGQRLWDAGKKTQALEVFKVAASECPWSFQAFDRLGDAYYDLGDSAQAMAMYRKSAGLNRRSYPWEVSSYEDASRLANGVKLLSRNLERDIASVGVPEAIKAFDSAKKGGPGTYYVDEQKINQLGYQLMNRGKVNDAIEIFKLNVREFPASSNTYDSLAEGYMRAGNRELAIQNYKKSLELDPKNTNAVEMLTQLAGGSEKIDEKLLDEYVGRYNSPFGIISITREGDKLFAQPEGRSKEELAARTATKFDVRTVGAQLEFVRDANGKVATIMLNVDGQKMEAKRLN
jgi:tetratricopeptide (TPR) repeat protein